MTKLVELREEMSAKLAENAVIRGQYPDLADIPTDVYEGVVARSAEITAIKAQVAELSGREDLFAAGEKLNDFLMQPHVGMVHPGGQPEQKTQAPQRYRISDQVMGDPEWKAWMKQVAPYGELQSGRNRLKISSPSISLKTLITGDSTTSAGAMVFPDILGGFYPLGRRPLVMRDVVTSAQTMSDTVEFVKVTSETNNAASVAEATATGNGSGAKPESAAAFEQVTTNVVTIAHWMPITRRALSDAGQMRAYIDDFLRDGVAQELEDQMVTGAGGSDLVGLSGTTGIQTDASTGNILTLLRRGRRKIRTVGRDIPNAYLLNPVDFEAVDLLTDNENRYYFGGPREVQNPYVWGLPVIESEAVTTGTAYVGNFKRAILWDREQANIQVSDSHSDFFVRNILAILAEARFAFGVVKPASIMKMVTTS